MTQSHGDFSHGEEAIIKMRGCHFGAQATERFGLPLRTIDFNYSVKIK